MECACYLSQVGVEDANLFPVGLLLSHELIVAFGNLIGVVSGAICKDDVQGYMVGSVVNGRAKSAFNVPTEK